MEFSVEVRASIPAAVFWTDFGNLGAQQTRLMVSEETLPKKGELVAIDAEFIALNKVMKSCFDVVELVKIAYLKSYLCIILTLFLTKISHKKLLSMEKRKEE